MTDHAAPLRAPLMAIATDKALPHDLRVLAADAADAQDVEAVLLRAGRALVAAESYASEIEARGKQIRGALLTVMVETGAPSFSTGTHTIGTSETARVRVFDPALIPPEFMTPREPVANTQAIKAAIDAGKTVPGAALSNAAPSIFVRASKRS